MNRNNHDRERPLIAAKADQWVSDLHDDPSARQDEFVQWLSRSPTHVAEFLRATALSSDLRGAVRADTTDLEALRAEVLANGDHDNVVPLNFEAAGAPGEDEPVVGPAVVPVPISRRVISFTSMLIAASVIIVAGALAWLGWTLQASSTYQTSIGEQRTLRLVDGSIMQLNTNSRAKVRFSDDVRDIQLLEGEAFFVVRHDSLRPFRVTAGDTVVQAVGTQFNVHRTDGATHVAVIEGKVKVVEPATQSDAPAQPQLLTAGEEVSIAPGHSTTVSKSGTAGSPVAWRQRKLVFNGQTLEEVAAEFNRYNQRRIVIRDPAARTKQLSGTFNADDPGSLMLFLNRLEDLKVSETADEFIVGGR